VASQRRHGKQKPELNLFEEMRQLAASDKSISPREILRMATLQGARALGLAGRTGELSNNTAADVIAIPAGTGLSNPYDTVLAHTGPVLASLIGGRWAISPAV
jgi:5-methylthioadenosine/S-adenosylhomocysteine deaminase